MTEGFRLRDEKNRLFWSEGNDTEMCKRWADKIDVNGDVGDLSRRRVRGWRAEAS